MNAELKQMRRHQARVSSRSKLARAVLEAMESRQMLSALPNGPYGLTATPVSTSEIDLNWYDNNNGAPVDGYVLNIAGQDPIGVSANVDSYKVGGLTAGKSYSFTVTAFNDAGDSSTDGPVEAAIAVSTPTPPPTGTVPNSPFALTATSISDSEIDLSWYDNNNGAAASGYTLNISGEAPVMLPALATSYKANGLAAGTLYSFNLTAFNNVGSSSTTGPVSAGTTGSAPGQTPGVPYAPWGLTAKVIKQTETDLTWFDPTSGPRIDGYQVITPDGTVLATLPGNATSYQDWHESPLTTRSYEVRAFETGGPSNPYPVSFSSVTGPVTTTTPAGSTNSPFGLTATTVSPYEIDLSWNDNTNGLPIDGYQVITPDGKVLATLPSTATSYQDTSLVPGSTHSYEVVSFAFEDAADPIPYYFSSPTGPVNATSLSFAPDAPYGLTATVVGHNEIDLNWFDNTTGQRIDGYEVLTSDGTLLATLPNTATSYQDTSLAPGTTRSYVVRSFDTNGPGYPYPDYFSSETGPVTATTTPAPSQAPNMPYNLTAKVISSSEIDLTWQNDTSGAPLDRLYLYATGIPGPVALPATATSYAVTGLPSGTPITFTLYAENSAGVSNPAGVTATTFSASAAPAAPANFTATAVSSNEIDLAWTQPAGGQIDSYELYYSDRPFGFALASTTATSYQLTDLLPGTAENFTLVAMNSAGRSYAMASATTLGEPLVAPVISVTQTESTSAVVQFTDPGGYFSFDVDVPGYGPYTSFVKSTGAGSTYTVSLPSLTPGTTYTISVQGAVQTPATATQFPLYIYGPQSQSVQFTLDNPIPATVPNSPFGLTATPVSSSEVDLAWYAPVGGTPIDGYYVDSSDGQQTILPSTATSVQAEGLDASRPYQFTVTAFNAVGNASAISTSATPLAEPSQPPPGPVPTFSLTDLGANVQPTGINLSGQIVGQLPSASGNGTVAFRSQPNTAPNLTTDALAGNDAYGINNAGQVIGTTAFAYAGFFPQFNAFRTTPTGDGSTAAEQLGTSSPSDLQPVAINSSGAVIVNPPYYDPAAGSDLIQPDGTVTPTTLGFVNGINDSGEIITRTARYKAGSTTGQLLGGLWQSFSSANYILPSAINNAGQVVGQSTTTPGGYSGPLHAFRTAPEAAINPATDDLGTLGGFTSDALAINNAGAVVGESATIDGSAHAFYVAPGSNKMIDLNTLVPANSGWVFNTATAINDKGQIVGQGTLNGVQHGFELTVM